MWKQHFEQLYNSVPYSDDKTEFLKRLSSLQPMDQPLHITVHDLSIACGNQKLRKAVGPDGIAVEALVHGGHRLLVHLCLLFNLFLRSNYLPIGLMESVIVPLVKCKSGDLSDVNNYRAIALSNSTSKLLESVIMRELNSVIISDHRQFGFKTGSSTAICTNVFKQSVAYYVNRGSHVFTCFVDFTKAFDRVNYWKLFSMLLDDNVNRHIVNLLAYWYSKQTVCVRWHAMTSEYFTIGNGTRQGGILSPMLFTRYVKGLLMKVGESRIGCNVADCMVNILAYADDIVLCAPSWRGLQHLINLLATELAHIDMLCNVNKTVCMVFVPKERVKTICRTFPNFQCNGICLNFVDKFKYLGHQISCDLSDDIDIGREIRNMFVRTNILIRKFGKCSHSVKLLLFKTYCLCWYDAALWYNHTASIMFKLQSCYNKCVKMFFGYDRRHSVTLMLLQLNLPSFATVMHNGKHVFMQSWMSSTNVLAHSMRSVGIQ
jgi:hypothetical protein